MQTQTQTTENLDFKEISFWNNAIVHWAIIANVFLNLAVVGMLLFYVRPSDVPIKLQYNVFFGTSLYTTHWWQVYILPVFCLVFFGIDLLLGNILYNFKERIGAYIILLGALFTQIALIIAVLSVIMNNF